MSTADGRRGRWVLRLALVWLALLAALAGLGQHMIGLDLRIRWEEDVRGEVREDLAVYDVQNPAAWSAEQRRVDRRIEGLRRELRLARALFLGLAVVGLAATVWLFRAGRGARPDGRTTLSQPRS